MIPTYNCEHYLRQFLTSLKINTVLEISLVLGLTFLIIEFNTQNQEIARTAVYPFLG